ncbi:phosphotransferase [Streptomyces celluloflavus]|uniref:phosphotransferase n=1 Tax=Streptomyces celluloflavus TaxID=58344 RepID=UPI00345F1755
MAGAAVLRQAVLRPARGGTAHPRSRRALPAPRDGRAGSRGFLHRDVHPGHALFDGQGDAPRDTGVVDWNFLCTEWSWMDMAIGERAQEGAERGGGTDTAERSRHRTVPQEVEVGGGVDAVCPAAMPPTMLVTFASAAAPAPSLTPVALAFSVTSRGRPHCSTGRITGTSPACAIRFGSSNAAESARRRMGNPHLGSALPIARAGSVKNSHHRKSQGTPPFSPTSSTGSSRGSRLSLTGVDVPQLREDDLWQPCT